MACVGPAVRNMERACIPRSDADLKAAGEKLAGYHKKQVPRLGRVK
jgi:hypothetical protein